MLFHTAMYMKLFSTGEILTFEAVVFQVFEFIQALVESRFKVVVKTHLDQLLYFLLVYMEITEDQVHKVDQVSLK